MLGGTPGRARDSRKLCVEEPRHAPGFQWRGDFGIHSCDKKSTARAGMDELSAEVILVFGEPAIVRAAIVRGSWVADGIRPPVRRARDFYRSSSPCARPCGCDKIVGAGVGGATAVVDEVVARPDAGVDLRRGGDSSGEWAAEHASLPRKAAFQHRPNRSREIAIAGPQQMAEHGVHGDNVHVVIGNNPRRCRCCECGLAAGEVVFFVGGGKFREWDVVILFLGETIDVAERAVMLAKGVSGIGAAPA